MHMQDAFASPLRGAVVRRWRAGLLLLMPLLFFAVQAKAVVRMVVDDHTLSGWSMEDGLPHNMVHSITQDKAGFIWVGTWEGAARFNGRSFTVFNRENTPGAEISGVFKFVAEADGSVLAGTADGVYQYRNNRWSALAPSAMSGMRINSMLRDRDGALWISSASELHRLGKDQRFETISGREGFPKAFVTTLAQARAGVVMVGTEGGLYQLSEGRIEPWGLADVAVRALADDRKGGWYVAADSGLWHVNASGISTAMRLDHSIDGVVFDRTGVLWLSEPRGALIRRDTSGNEIKIAVPGLLNSAVFEDAEGLIWAGSSDGLFQVSRGAAHGVSGSEGYTRVVLQAEDDAIWIGSSDGLKRLASGAMKAVSLGEASSSILALGKSRRKNAIWAGTYDKGVVEVDAAGNVVRRIPLIHQGGASLVRSVLEARDGTVWIGSGWHGLYRFKDGELSHLLDQPGMDAYSIQALFEDRAGNIWGGTVDGMFRVDAAGNVRHWASDKDIPARSIFDFHEDADGTLWLASDRGFLRLQGDTFSVYDYKRGLPRDKIFRVIADDRGYIWLASNRGIYRIDRNQIQQIDEGVRTQLSVVVVDHTDGMPSIQGSGGTWPSGWLTRAGNLLFPTPAGLGIIDPKRVEGVRAGAVPVVLKQIAVDGVLQDVSGKVEMKGDGRRLLLQYAGIEFRAPERVRYRYRMRGFDEAWIDADDSTEAVYTNLPAGKYIFELQAMRLPLDWSDSARIGTAQLQVAVILPVWRHWTVLSSLIVLLVAAMGLFWWWRMSRYRRHQHVLNRIIAERTRELTHKNQELEISAGERDALLKKLSYQASHDSLTGLPNRRAADRHLEEALAQAFENGQSLCVALLDIDHFKGINDGYGHDAGDQVLCRIGERLKRISGVDVFSSRHGGEEFLLVIAGMSEQDARDTLETLRKDIAAESLTLDDGRLLRYTVSIGMASFSAHLQSTRQLLGTADQRLYEAKGRGRNRVVG